MKDNIMLINTSRALINTTDIIDAKKMVKLVMGLMYTNKKRICFRDFQDIIIHDIH
jgi:lactate dehydrogenase-like 2-hydroxyacid dehydrogenase